MVTADIRVGDSVRVLDTFYTRGEPSIAHLIGQVGIVVAVTPTPADTLGFGAIYLIDDPTRPGYLGLIEADLELVARPAWIT